MRSYTVNEIVELTGQKRGTIEQFRNELQKLGLIANNQRLDERTVDVFKEAVKYKENEDCTWGFAMQRAIQLEFDQEIERPFKWTADVHLAHLIYLIDNDLVEMDTNELKNPSLDWHVIFTIMIDNFKALGKKYEFYKGSQGTDGNGATTFKLIGPDYIYYIVGKLNFYTRNEEIHIFYNEGLVFNIMRCKYITGGNSENGLIKDLLFKCWKKKSDKMQLK